jgi:hypothetical protein
VKIKILIHDNHSMVVSSDVLHARIATKSTSPQIMTVHEDNDACLKWFHVSNADGMSAFCISQSLQNLRQLRGGVFEAVVELVIHPRLSNLGIHCRSFPDSS